MNDEIFYIIIGAFIGGVIAWLLAQSFLLKSGAYISSGVVKEQYVLRDLMNDLKTRFDALGLVHDKKLDELSTLQRDTASLEQINAHLEDKLATQKEELIVLEKKFQSEFENIANRLLEEKSERFSQQNKQQIGDLLLPLHEKIKDFEQNIERKYVEDLKERMTLKTEIENLRLLNQQLSQDAHNLTSALRSDNKTQGDWGELRLEILLEKAGLQKNVHYQTQLSFTDDNGQQKRPDCIVQLPGNKQMVIDSKVSLVHFERHLSSEDAEEKKSALRAHLDSMKTHVKGLNGKNYAHIAQINTLDYVMMFVPIETAFSLAQQEDARFFSDALDKNILIVTPTTLLATMRTVAFLWSQENQKRNVLEIAKQSGLLYDKFVSFIEDLKEIGRRLNMANGAYEDAMHKLTDGKRFGDTLIGRAEKIRELGAKNTKTMPPELVGAPDEIEEL